MIGSPDHGDNLLVSEDVVQLADGAVLQVLVHGDGEGAHQLLQHPAGTVTQLQLQSQSQSHPILQHPAGTVTQLH